MLEIEGKFFVFIIVSQIFSLREVIFLLSMLSGLQQHRKKMTVEVLASVQ